MDDSAVSIKAVSKHFGPRAALSDLSLEVPKGAIFGVIGPNGSGKTTTLRLILNIYEPDAGDVCVLGKRGRRGANDRIGYLPEERGLYRKMKVTTQLAYFARLKGMEGKVLNEAIDYWLEKVGLAESHNLRIEQLSKGMAQKIQFVSAIIFKPELLILDEPFSGLDPVSLDLINSIIRELQADGVTIILSTHDMSVAERLCDQVVMIHQGKKVLDGTIQAIREEYGQDKIYLQFSGSHEQIQSMPGVGAIHESGRFLEVSYTGSPQHFLRLLMDCGDVAHFELAHPSLHDIFVRKATLTETELKALEV